MAQRVTIKDIAEKTGTSVASVHRAIYGTKGISESLRQKILLEVENSNYRMDEAASMLRRGKFYITVLLPKPEGEERFYYRGLWDGIYRGAREIQKNKVKIKFVETTAGVEHICEALEHLFDETDERMNGLITICDDEESRGWIQRFIKRGTAVALVDRGVPIKNLCCCMETSSRDMGRLAMNMMEFLTRDDKKGSIVFVNGPDRRVSYRMYAQAVKEQMSLMGKGRELIVLNGYEGAKGRNELRELIAAGNVSGVIAGCARATYWVCDEMNKMAIDDLPPVVGTDVFEELAPFFENGILKASIYQSHREHGERAMRYLYEVLSNPYMKPEAVPPGALSLVLKENYKYFI